GNEAFSRLGGFTGSRGLSMKQVAVDTIADEEVRTILREALERGEGISMEVPGPATLEGEHWREIRLSPVRGEGGAITHFVGILTDITERRLAARELAWRASHEALTGLPNRDCLVDAVDRALAEGGDGVA